MIWRFATEFENSDVLAVNEVSGGAWLTIAMLTDRAPFNDARVRQAMRLIIDRQQILDRALQGHGTIGNDLFGFIDQTYNANKFPQRVPDLAKAVALLGDFGGDGFDLRLVSGVELSSAGVGEKLLSQRAGEAGVAEDERFSEADDIGELLAGGENARGFDGFAAGILGSPSADGMKDRNTNGKE